MKVILILFSLGLINFISSHKLKNIDLTSNEINSLTQETRDVLKERNEEVTAYIIARGENQLKIQKLLDLFKAYNNQITVVQIDPEKEITFIREKNITRLPAVLFQKGSKSKSYISP